MREAGGTAQARRFEEQKKTPFPSRSRWLLREKALWGAYRAHLPQGRGWGEGKYVLLSDLRFPRLTGELDEDVAVLGHP